MSRKVTNIEFKYPVLLIKDSDNNLYGTTKGIGLISRGGDSFYEQPIRMIDSAGHVFNLNKSKNIGRAKFFDSLRYFQPMQQMHLEFYQEGQISLTELKNYILKHIKMKPKHWSSLGTINMIEKWVNEKDSISELILIFK